MQMQTRYGTVMQFAVPSPDEHQKQIRDPKNDPAMVLAYYTRDIHARLDIHSRPIRFSEPAPGSPRAELQTLLTDFMQKLMSFGVTLDTIGFGKPERTAEVNAEMMQVHGEYMEALKKLAGPNFKLVGFCGERGPSNKDADFEQFRGQFVSELADVHHEAMALTHQYHPDFHRQFFVTSELIRQLSEQLIIARNVTEESQLKSVRTVVRSELAAFQYQLREIEYPRLTGEDQAGKIPPVVLGVEFARGWLMREWQYINHMLPHAAPTVGRSSKEGAALALVEYAQVLQRYENRILGAMGHSDLQDIYEELNETSNRYCLKIFEQPAA